MDRTPAQQRAHERALRDVNGENRGDSMGLFRSAVCFSIGAWLVVLIGLGSAAIALGITVGAFLMVFAARLSNRWR